MITSTGCIRQWDVPISPLRKVTFVAPAFVRFSSRARASHPSVEPVGLARGADALGGEELRRCRRRSPRSSTISPSCSSARAVGARSLTKPAGLSRGYRRSVLVIQIGGDRSHASVVDPHQPLDPQQLALDSPSRARSAACPTPAPPSVAGKSPSCSTRSAFHVSSDDQVF